MNIPKFNTENYDEFMTAFSTLVSRIYGAFDLPLDYLLQDNDAPANYNNVYANRYEKLRLCVLLVTGPRFTTDFKAHYSLYVEHVRTTGHGSTTINRFKNSQNGYLCHQAFWKHYANRAYQDNRATNAN